MEGQLRLFILFLFTIITFAIFSPTAEAKETRGYIKEVNAKVYINQVGKGEYRENISYYSPSSLNWKIFHTKIKNLRVYTDGQLINNSDLSIKKDNIGLVISSGPEITGENWQIKFSSNSAITFKKQGEFFNWEIVGESGYVIEKINTELSSELPLPNAKNSTRIFAFHGVNESSWKKVNNNKILFNGSGLGTQAGFTIYTCWREGYFKVGLIQQQLNRLSLAEYLFWILFGLLLPLITLILMITILIKHRRKIKHITIKQNFTTPPSDLPPLLIGILMEKKIDMKLLLATIFDLCERGYLLILKHEGQYIIGKRKQTDDNLRLWEKKLMEEIFSNDIVWSKEKAIKKRMKAKLFSEKIKNIYEIAYEAVTRLDYFTENPRLVQMRYKLIGIFLYLISIIGICWVTLSFQSSYLLIPLFGVFLSNLVIIRFAPIMAIESQKGLDEQAKWTTFRNYLKDKKTERSLNAVGGLFHKYLPYAIAMKVERAWARRFRDYHIVMPDWFTSGCIEMAPEQAIQETILIVHQLSNNLNQLSGPTVE